MILAPKWRCHPAVFYVKLPRWKAEIAREGLGEVVQPEDYSKRILGRWLGRRKYVAFFADGSWGGPTQRANPDRNQRTPVAHRSKKLLLTWRGEAGLQTTERIITSFMTKRFVTEGGGRNETYDWAP